MLALSGGLQPDLNAKGIGLRSVPPTYSQSPERATGFLLLPTVGVLTRARVAFHRRERTASDRNIALIALA